jgi:hypothetical protein
MSLNMAGFASLTHSAGLHPAANQGANRFMNPRFTRGEYWLLETVVEGSRPLCFLPEPGVSQALNKPSHGMHSVMLMDTLEGLFDLGLIHFARYGNEGTGPMAGCLGRKEMETAFEERLGSPFQTHYALTAEGGRQWEAFAAPRWDRYVECSTRYDRSGSREMGVLISPDRARLERLLNGAHHMGQAVNSKHVHWRVLRPWQATYWKQLPEAHLVCYRFEEFKFNFGDNPHWFMKFYENRGWYRWQ